LKEDIIPVSNAGRSGQEQDQEQSLQSESVRVEGEGLVHNNIKILREVKGC
jgi:hypothetical protein